MGLVDPPRPRSRRHHTWSRCWRPSIRIGQELWSVSSAKVSHPPRRVTIVAHDVGPIGGMERQLTQLIVGLLGRGYAVTVVARRCDLPPHPALRWVRVSGP